MTARTVNMMYFAWVRERIGTNQEQLNVPDSVTTGQQLLDWMAGLGDDYARALEHPEIIRIAVNQRHIDNGAPLGDASEIALFPPMTGG